MNPIQDIERDHQFMLAHQIVKPFTMTSIERQYALWEAVKYLDRIQVPGTIVEVGVWKGGSAMLAGLCSKQLGLSNRAIHLYDTFEGMTEPSEVDVDCDGRPGERLWRSDYMKVSEEEVKENLSLCGCPEQTFFTHKGDIREAYSFPMWISLLRIDVDFYDSTLSALKRFWRYLVSGGVLILDDYGYWAGAKKAADEFFEGQNVFMHRIDTEGRLVIKP